MECTDSEHPVVYFLQWKNDNSKFHSVLGCKQLGIRHGFPCAIVVPFTADQKKVCHPDGLSGTDSIGLSGEYSAVSVLFCPCCFGNVRIDAAASEYRLCRNRIPCSIEESSAVNISDMDAQELVLQIESDEIPDLCTHNLVKSYCQYSPPALSEFSYVFSKEATVFSSQTEQENPH